ncbi:hypothetical protein BH11ACT8_BH11ACT8_12190 [soil metagenome]
MTTTTSNCCKNHDGPHLHGCVRPRTGELDHSGICLLEQPAPIASDDPSGAAVGRITNNLAYRTGSDGRVRRGGAL